jgi:hypothetical protein
VPAISANKTPTPYTIREAFDIASLNKGPGGVSRRVCMGAKTKHLSQAQIVAKLQQTLPLLFHALPMSMTQVLYLDMPSFWAKGMDLV